MVFCDFSICLPTCFFVIHVYGEMTGHSLIEPPREKTSLQGFRPDTTQTPAYKPIEESYNFKILGKGREGIVLSL